MRLIDADELKAKVEAMVEHKVQESDYDYSRNQTLDYVADILIEDAPTIYAEPVKHGEWKYYYFSDINNPYVGWYECTVCKHHEYSEREYCPNCGAKMKGEKMTKQKILDYLNNVLHPIVTPNNWNIYSELYDMIEELPSEEPAWHGKWEMNSDPFGFFDGVLVCSECGCKPKMREKTKYCPNCGAKMDKGGEQK